MKILAFSINPIFPDRVTGGASKHLERVLRYLGEKGNQVTLLCAAVPGSKFEFELHSNVFVKAILPFHLPFPQPYAVSPFELSSISHTILIEISGKDRFYIHDGELLLPELYTHIPTISSFRDNVYPESVLGSFIGQADEIICVSPYSADVIRSSAGLVLSGLDERIHVVPNGIDPEVFHPSDPDPVAKELLLDLNKHRFLLHPHRPESSKGLKESLKILEKLINQFGQKDLILLSPDWLPEMQGHLENSFKQLILDFIETHGLQEHVRFHGWLRQDQLASYYSCGALTLSVGNNPEAFGNVAYESIACGTPSVVAMVGTHRTQLPDSLVYKTQYDNPSEAAEICYLILKNNLRVSERDRLEVLSLLNLERQLTAYSSIILSATKREPMQINPQKINSAKSYRLAPWCDLTSRGIFNDYKGRYLTDEDWEGMTELSKILLSSGSVSASYTERTRLSKLIELGVLVPNFI